ncbi:MAG: L,D-transpeptidase catalytic domain protein, partial [Bradyrhizobium sp.]
MEKNQTSSDVYGATCGDRPLPAIRIRAAAGDRRRGWLTAGAQTIPVALGRSG